MQLAETLTQLRVGNQKFLLDFYQRSRHLFARWAQRQHGLDAGAAHQLLRDTLLEFYDQVSDGRLTRLPADVRAHIYGLARQRLLGEAQPVEQPVAERRQRLLGFYRQLGPDCRQVLSYFYFRGYRLGTVAAKLGFANASLAQRQKTSCLRKLLDLLLRSPAATR